jgi:TIR domain
VLCVWQLPMCDARLLSAAGSRVDAPDWPTPEIASDFVRGFGRVLRRRQGGHEEFLDEGVYAAADHALRFDGLDAHPLKVRDAAAVPDVAFRRLLCSDRQKGGVCTRLEVGLRIPSRRSGPPGTLRLAGRDWIDLALQIAELPVKVRSTQPAAARRSTLWTCGPALASAYLEATSPKGTRIDAVRRLVSAGPPLLFIEYEPEEAESLPAGARAIEPERVGGLALRFQWFEYRRREFGVWFLRRDAERKAVTRRLRVGLLRLHAEHQALRTVLSHVLGGRLAYRRGTPEEKPFNDYLQNAMYILGRDQHGGFSHAALQEVLSAYQSVVNGEELKLLDDRLEQVRRQVRVPVAAYSTAAAGMPASAGLPAPTVEKGDAVRVFVSYSHLDAEYLQPGSLVHYVSGGLANDRIDFWYDSDLKGGDLWDERIREELDRADIALVLVSQWFLNSRYITDVEATTFIEAMRARGLRVYPVILRKCDWETRAWLARTQFQPPGGKTLEDDFSSRAAREGLFLTILQELRASADEMRAARRVAPPPVAVDDQHPCAPPITVSGSFSGSFWDEPHGG